MLLNLLSICGRRPDGMDGLAAKCPAISVTNIATSKNTPILDDSVSDSELVNWTRITTSRKGIIWNKELYDLWNSGGTVYYLTKPVGNDEPMTKEEEDYLYQCYLQDRGADSSS